MTFEKQIHIVPLTDDIISKLVEGQVTTRPVDFGLIRWSNCPHISMLHCRQESSMLDIILVLAQFSELRSTLYILMHSRQFEGIICIKKAAEHFFTFSEI